VRRRGRYRLRLDMRHADAFRWSSFHRGNPLLGRVGKRSHEHAVCSDMSSLDKVEDPLLMRGFGVSVTRPVIKACSTAPSSTSPSKSSAPDSYYCNHKNQFT
jgi:hypothetical protein